MSRRRIYGTNAARQAAYRRRKREKVYFRHRSQEWGTPRDFFAQVDAEFHFTVDVAARPENACCTRFYTAADNGLLQSWVGRCWCNPPYGAREIPKWMHKAYASAQAGALVVCLVPARTDTRWWHTYVLPHAEVRFIPGRLKFNGSPNSAPFPSALVVFWPPAPF